MSNSVSVGQFKVNSGGMQQLMHSIDLDAVKLDFLINSQKMERVIHACGVLYVTAMNGLVKIMSVRQSAYE